MKPITVTHPIEGSGMTLNVLDGKWSCPYCKEKDKRIKELEEEIKKLKEKKKEYAYG